MVYPLNAVVSLLVLKNRRVQNRGALTAISAFTPGILGLAVPFVAENAAEHEHEHAKPGEQNGDRRMHRESGGGNASPPVKATQSYLPDLTGLTLQAVQQKLQHLGLTVQSTDVYSVGSHGTVVAQSPAANSVVDLASPMVTVNIGRQMPAAVAQPVLSTRQELDSINSTMKNVLSIVTGLQQAAARATGASGQSVVDGATGATGGATGAVIGVTGAGTSGASGATGAGATGSGTTGAGGDGSTGAVMSVTGDGATGAAAKGATGAGSVATVQPAASGGGSGTKPSKPGATG